MILINRTRFIDWVKSQRPSTFKRNIYQGIYWVCMRKAFIGDVSNYYTYDYTFRFMKTPNSNKYVEIKWVTSKTLDDQVAMNIIDLHASRILKNSE